MKKTNIIKNIVPLTIDEQRRLIAISESTIRKNNVKRFGLSKKEAKQQYQSIIQASPYLLDINEINDIFTKYHENQSRFKKLISLRLKSKFSIDEYKVFYIKQADFIEFYIFDNNNPKKATSILYTLSLAKNWSRNGLFKSSAKGWYLSNVWKSYALSSCPNLTARFLRKLVVYLKYDYITTDAAQTIAANKAFIQFAKSYINSDCVYVAVSNRSSKKVVALIESYDQLTEAMKLISSTNVSDMLKSIVVLSARLNASSIYKIFHNDVKEFTYTNAKRQGYLTNHYLDGKDELLKRGYIIQNFEDINL